MGAGWGWVFVGTMLVIIGLYLGLGMIITRGKFPVSRARVKPHDDLHGVRDSNHLPQARLWKCSTRIFGPGLSRWFATGCGGPWG